ncbi:MULTISPECIES: glycosyltransferase family 2 protein [Halomonadaceae]|uniref:glycosyltransferase family 2 protein n=1 Tax=Halomonadaceae TaxID=28256 RepID=UPI001598C966|nr:MULTISPECIES: glycosyltransferase family 2 protein [Halomonas]QJQ96041.1 glycosyltransferase family 2 protein [Halomonas sp. PA5]
MAETQRLSQVDDAAPAGAGIVAVIVTYRPELDVLATLLDSLIPQVEAVVIVDNGSAENVPAWNAARHPAASHVLAMGDNRGIAAAQNAGIDWARQQDARYVLLMDQDSLPAPDMVATLRAALDSQARPAAAGPRYRDPRQENPPPFLQIRKMRLHRHRCECGEAILPVDYLIASGCLIPMAVLDHVGGMREDLFIDYVDIEWGLRAAHHGYQSYGVCAAHMQHSLGEAPLQFRGRKIPLHSPLRHYYHFRNAVLLYRTPWVPRQWKCVDAWRLLLKYGFYTLYAKPRWQHWWKMTQGVLHGMRGRAGRLD